MSVEIEFHIVFTKLKKSMPQGSITYKVVDGYKTVIRYFVGAVSFEGSIEPWRDIIGLKVCEIQPKGAISDFSESGTMYSNTNIPKLIEFIVQHIIFISGLISAAIIQQSDKTVSGELVKEGISEHKLPFKLELFYSHEVPALFA